VAVLAADDSDSGGSDPPSTFADSNQVPPGELVSPPQEHGERVSQTREQE